MNDLVLTLGRRHEAQTTRVQVFDENNKMHGTAVLSSWAPEAKFTIEDGAYSIRIERSDASPKHVLRRIEGDTILDVSEILEPLLERSVPYTDAQARPQQYAKSVSRATVPTAGPQEIEAWIDLSAPSDLLPLPSVTDHGLSRLQDTREARGVDYVGSLLADHTRRKTPSLRVEGTLVEPERSGLRLPDHRSLRLYGDTDVQIGGRLIPKLRSRYRLTPSPEVAIDSAIIMSVKSSDDYPGDVLEIRPQEPWIFDTDHITLGSDYRAPLFWLQERKSDVSTAKFIAVPLFASGVELGFDADNRQLIGVRGTDRRELSALLNSLSAKLPVGTDAVARHLFEGVEPLEDGMDPSEFAIRLLRDKFMDPYAAAVAGYFMIRFNFFKSLRDWSRNLADYFPFMSDGCVIEGWRRLIVRGDRGNPPWPKWRIERQPPPSPLNEEPNRPRPDDPIEDASRRFLEAHARGLPTFHFGLQKLLDGLLFCYDRTDDSSLTIELTNAIDDISAAFERSSSSAGLTTIRFLKDTPGS